MTTRFDTADQRLAAVLPTTGQGGCGTPIDPPRIIAITVVPAGADPDASTASLQRLARTWPTSGPVDLRIGHGEPLRLTGAADELDRVHAYVAQGLAAFEQPGAERSTQVEIGIHCYSGLSWKHAVTAYDAVRGYENERTRGQPDGAALARAVSFAPPRIRDATPTIQGEEIWDILHQRPGG
jgi:hypothetical protein